MSLGQTFRPAGNERLSAAEEDPSERGDEGTRWARVHGADVQIHREIPETPAIKEEPDERSVTAAVAKNEAQRQTERREGAQQQSVKREEEQLPQFVTVIVKSEVEPAPSGDASETEADEAIKHECPFCNKVFTKKNNLKQHTRVHTGEKPYSCSFCKQMFGHLSALKVHLRIHTGEKPYICSICMKTFVQREHLQVHMRTHTGEKPYSCSVCGKTFTRNCFLVGHMRTHTGEKPFSCSTCDKTFTFKYKLDVHTRTHTGERPYGCAECGAAFTQKPHLDRHVSNMHAGKKKKEVEEEEEVSRALADAAPVSKPLTFPESSAEAQKSLSST